MIAQSRGAVVQGEGGDVGGKRWVVGKERSGSRLSTQSHHRQGYRPDTVSTLCPEHPHKSPDGQTQQSNSTLIPSAGAPKVPRARLCGPTGCRWEPRQLLIIQDVG